MTSAGHAHKAGVDLCDLSATATAVQTQPPSVSAHLLRFVLKELIQTEKDYVKDLGIVVEVGSNAVGVFCFRPIRDGESRT